MTALPMQQPTFRFAQNDDSTNNIDWLGFLKPSGNTPTKLNTRAEASTNEQDAELIAEQYVLRYITGLFQMARYENFEYGMNNEFITQLAHTVDEYGQTAIQAISSIILTNQAESEVVAEALRFLGEIEDPESYSFRLIVMILCLKNSSRWIRDAAGQALDALEDSRAIPALKSAMSVEKVPDLQKDFEMVIRRLEGAT